MEKREGDDANRNIGKINNKATRRGSVDALSSAIQFGIDRNQAHHFIISFQIFCLKKGEKKKTIKDKKLWHVADRTRC